MTKAEFIDLILPVIQRSIESAVGIADWMGEQSPEEAADTIADIVPPIAWSDERESVS